MNALVFPGQGSQKIGMAKAVVEAYSWASNMAALTDSVLDRSITEICFNGPEDALKETINTQPAIFFASAVLFEALKRDGYSFSAVAGHSLGEYSALYAAGVACYEDLLRLVDARARAMEMACPTGTGAMSAVLMLPLDILEAVCREASQIGPCVIANYNCPGQAVISGAAPAVVQAGKLALAKGAKRVIPLEVSGPFHSSLMTQAGDKLAYAVDKIKFNDAEIPVYANIDAAPTTKADDIKRKLINQLTGAVRWESTIKRMYQDGFDRFVEVGSGKVLSGLIKKIEPNAAISSVQDPESLNQLLSETSVAMSQKR